MRVVGLARRPEGESHAATGAEWLRQRVGIVEFSSISQSRPVSAPGASPYTELRTSCRRRLRLGATAVAGSALGGCAMSVSAVSLKGRAMEKILCFGSLGIAVLMLLAFLLDLVASVPFGGGPFGTVDILGVLA